MREEKKCSKCGDTKPLSEFGVSKGGRYGRHSSCKACANESTKEFRRTKVGLVTKIYSTQRDSSKRRGHDMPKYSKRELGWNGYLLKRYIMSFMQIG